MESRQLSIPIYLNQRIVFDLLAIVEGGFSQLQSIRTTQADSSGITKDASAEVGVKNVFAFLNLGVKGSIAKKDDQSSQKAIEEQRVFTPASLFSRLRDALNKHKLLVTLDETSNIDLQPGTFVEFTGVLRKNPTVGYMEGVIQLYETGLFLQGFGQSNTAGKGKQKEDPTLNEMKKFSKMLTSSGSLDLLAQVRGTDMSAIVPVQLEYFSDESPADIIDGQFVILGKVVRFVDGDSDDSISLLRTTPLAHMPEEAMGELTTAFTSLGSDMKTLGDFKTHIQGPAFQIVPIAIFA